MKRPVITLVALLSTVFFLTGADYKKERSSAALPVKKICLGYNIIEAGKGIDCNGDTIKLVKRNGFYEREQITRVTQPK